MGWDRTWRLSKSRLKIDRVQDAAAKVARGYAGVRVLVEKDGEDMMCVFTVPAPDDNELEIEVSIYNLGKDGHVISLEADTADNHEIWDDASQLAEDLAERLEATELEL
ncbi:MAG: hypothetical protein P8R54_25140 [Myxococcota bacterium]|jgi:hypothetical protein|nr:hypothetical protein [Myxococcota bacterium]